jgi:hypothetical protein
MAGVSMGECGWRKKGERERGVEERGSELRLGGSGRGKGAAEQRLEGI